MVKFIFSTKNYGDISKYVFYEKRCMDDKSSIIKMILDDNQFFLDLVDKKLSEPGSDKLKEEMALELNIDTSEIDQNSIESLDAHKYAFIHASKLDRFSYYTSASNNDPDGNAFAVQCWRESSVEWINALVQDDTLGNKLGNSDTLYLMLHDKDVPGYEDKSFEILSPQEIKKIGIKGNLIDNDSRFVYSGYEVKIVIFNHVNNAIVDILEKAKLGDACISDKINAIFNNHKVLKEIFCNNSKDFQSLDVNGFVDLCNHKLNAVIDDSKQLFSTRNVYSYVDENGALLTELMHAKAYVRSSTQFMTLIDELRKPAYKDNTKVIIKDNIKKMKFPVIIKIRNFFGEWAEAVGNDSDKKNQILNHRNKKTLDDNLKRALSFFNNSSIFIRLVFIDDQDAVDKAVDEFEYFDRIGLYDYESAWENLEYNTRIQPQNYLESYAGGHGNFVTPMLYGDEEYAKRILKDNNVTPDLPETVDTFDFRHLRHFHDIALRILLIDDKVGGRDPKCIPKVVIDIPDSHLGVNETSKAIELKDCSNCSNNKECKLRTIKKLMDAGQEKEGKNKLFEDIGVKSDAMNLKKDYFYWNETDIQYYYCPTVFPDFIDNDQITKEYEEFNVFSNQFEKKGSKSILNVSCDFTELKSIKDDNNSAHVQIIGVQDVRTALLLLSKYKFDMVFCDYLLDYKKPDSRDQRDFANQFFDFLSREYEKEDGLKESRKKLLNKLRHDVLDNRGPLGKLWIMPITGFNQTFIQDLYRNGTNLIDYRWNISNGADPITTPWQFLFHLNKQIELQLRMCVYKREQILKFLLITCEDLKELDKNNSQKLSFEDFKSIMGSDYATFVQLYGNRLPIKRDALIESKNNDDNKSVFATYIWDKFYRNPEYYDVIELNRLAHKFYHQASTMYNDLAGRQRLNEAFANLDFFVRTNNRIKEIINDTNHKDLLPLIDDNNGLACLRKVIAECTKD